MNRTQLLSIITLLAGSVISGAAVAQATGGPASFEHDRAPRSDAVETLRAAEHAKAGPYAKWLMLNGMPEDVALRTAKSTDQAGENATARYAKAR